MNKEAEIELLTPSQRQHRSKLWWTVYIMDQRLTTLMGVPSLIHDEDVSLPMPDISSENAAESTFGFHAKLSSHLGQVLKGKYYLSNQKCSEADMVHMVVVYGHQRQLGGKFIAGIQSILLKLAETSQALNKYQTIELQNPKNTPSRTAASLHLLYHQVGYK